MNATFNRQLKLALAILLIAGATHAEDKLQTRPRYILRAGDTLDLQYRLTPEFNQTVMVQPDGYINLNVAGTVSVSGLTVDQAHDLIVSKASEKLKDPEITLVLESFTHPYVVIAGQVAKPGQIELKENTTALGAIMMAGGFTPNAKAGQVIVFRKVNDSIAEVKILHLARIDKTSKLEKDMALQPGDMILVPQDRISKIEHYLQVANVGMYMNPLAGIP
ncbi:MAG TPA: polysaccharide biosynthesis/export family protein [Terracidiphilus sp.]|jgi:polysaccharide export outer membrane protein